MGSFGWKGWQIGDCDGTECGGDVCRNEGECFLHQDRPGGFECDCGQTEFQVSFITVFALELKVDRLLSKQIMTFSAFQ